MCRHPTRSLRGQWTDTIFITDNNDRGAARKMEHPRTGTEVYGRERKVISVKLLIPLCLSSRLILSTLYLLMGVDGAHTLPMRSRSLVALSNRSLSPPHKNTS